MRKLSTILVASIAAIMATAATARPVNFAVYGDAPYGTSPADKAQVALTPAFVSAVNADSAVSLVLHVGDIHSGKEYCTVNYDTTVYDLWTAYTKPLVYTPGDNEWTDCHKKKEGGGAYNATTGVIDYVVDALGNPVDYASGNPVSNLDLVRSLFFSNPGHTLGADSKVVSQRTHYDRRFAGDAAFVENVYFMRNDVLVVAVNVPGGSNNDQDVWYGAPTMSAQQAAEIAVRTGATTRWLDKAFKVAQSEGAKAVIIMTQADMWDLDGNTAGHLTGYEPIIASIASNVAAFAKPVLLFNGDSHLFRSDNPLVQGAPCVSEATSGAAVTACASDDWLNHPSYNVPNFHRVVVHGSTAPLEYLRLTIDTERKNGATDSSFGPFSWVRVNP
ncbi:MAG: hypothetical protein WCH32_17180 [Pseudomonadota bacterium]